MIVEEIPEWALSATDDAAIAALLRLAFGPEFGGRSYHHQRHDLRLVARDPAIVGHIALSWRKVRLGPDWHEVAALAEVGTHPERRGQGIAQALLQRAIAAARGRGLPFVLLFGDAALYPAAGFRPAANALTYLEIQAGRSIALRQEPADSLMVLPLGALPWDAAAPLDLLGAMF